MRRKKAFITVLLWLPVLISRPAISSAATNPRWARVSIFATAAQRSFTGGGDDLFSELVAKLTLRSTAGADGGIEYEIDARVAGYPSVEGRKERVSVYEGYIGWKAGGGLFGIRAGQVWLDELGALGSLGGLAAEVRPVRHLPMGLGELRIGAFAGLEPRIFEAGYLTDVKKVGGYLSIDGPAARRHVIGYVHIRNRDLTERSVLVFSNFIPVQRLISIYQAAEYDLRGPAGQGSGKLTYFFSNVRFSPSRILELQGIYHHGRSIDARRIADLVHSGQPVDEASLDGFLHESIGGRLTLRFLPSLQVFAGYAQEKTGAQAEKRDRLTLGLFASNLFKSEFDLRITDTRFAQDGGSSYDAWFVSLGKTFGRSVYLEGFYNSSISVLRYFGGDIGIVRRPRTDRFGCSSNIYFTRSVSLLLTLERTSGDDLSETRLLAGFSYRF
jgi:hypothetical protein